ncbi:hypothetical protein GCM10009551_088800 [Nocardiopsis tropica]
MEMASTKSRRTENSEFTAFVNRVIAAHGRRVASSDPESLAALVAVRAEVDQAIEAGVAGLRAGGYSWAAIAAPMGMTKQAAFKRWGNQ